MGLKLRINKNIRNPMKAKNFKEFILRGNVVDLAIGIVIGAAFSDLINSFVSSFLTPFISLIGGQPNFSRIQFTINNVTFPIGDFFTAIISFAIIALVLYFLVVLPMNRFMEYVRTEESPDPTSKKCSYCFTEIPIKAHRCPNCTSELESGKVEK